MSKCIPRMTTDSATALSTLQAENEKLRAELEQVTAERDAAVRQVALISQPNDPLTLERLREMDGQPVRMEDLTGGTLWNQWIIFERHTDDGFIPRGGGYFGCDSYGVKWLAYAYPPAHIDREVWEPCAKCVGCGNCYYFLYDDDEYPCDKCLKGSTAKNPYPEFKPIGFCKHCGRPLTEKAWAELEKRTGAMV